MILSSAIQHPSGTPVFLVTIQAGVWCRAWVLDSGIRYKCPLSDAPSAVMWNNATGLAVQTSTAAVAAGAGRYYWDGTYLYVSTPGGANIWEGTVQALINVYVSTHPKQLNSIYWEPRVKSVPNLSQRIEAQFGGVGQIGGGTMVLINSDGWFDSRRHWQWNARTVSIKMGMDLPGNDAVYADYEQVATWAIEEWTTTADGFTLRLKEPKARIKSQIPVATFARADFPNIDQSLIGKTIPDAYGRLVGIKAFLIDPGTKRYKLCGHAIRSIDAAYIKRTVENTQSAVQTGWLTYSGNTRRIYFAGKTAKKVVNTSTTLTKKEELADVTSTANSWVLEDDWLYINVASLGTVTVTFSIETQTTQAITIPALYLSVGEFTVEDLVSSSDAVYVDFTGKPNVYGDAIISCADVIQDLLLSVGETALNTASFTEATRVLTLGILETGANFYMRQLALYIDSKRSVADLISDINAVCGSFVYTDANGQYYLGIFRPKVRPAMFDLDESDLLDWQELAGTDKITTKFSCRYLIDDAQGNAQLAEFDRTSEQQVSNQPEPVEKLVDLPFPEQSDADEYAQRMSLQQSVPLKKFSCSVKWKGWSYLLGDQITINHGLRGIYGKYEVLERNVDFGSMTVKFVLGNLRGYEDRPGWWVDSAATLPSQFASLAGYGSGSLVWNASWHPDIKRWARNNVGYWTDDNGFANSSDPDSFIPSMWT